ncbi:protein-disulfide reductase DsbD [Halomonas cupida]|uniref:protein-disulfide reductase DsbD n=1 Tax=Halomonas cupida TaxID=44933 RepID=UPI003EF20EDE
MRQHSDASRYPDRLWRVVVISLLSLAWTLPALAQGTFSSSQSFLPADEAFQPSAITQDGQLHLRWEIADGYYLYRKRLEIETPEGTQLPVTLPDGESITDEYFGESEVYHDVLNATVTPGEAQYLSLSWQGCAEEGLCYAPQRADLRLDDLTFVSPGSVDNDMSAETPTAASTTSGSDARSSSESTSPPASQPSNRDTTATASLGEDQALAQRLGQAGIGWALAAFFGMGLLLTFTPCVLPMVPILSSLVVGSGVSTRRGLMLSVAFVVPMALTYALLGVAAAMAGANLQAMLQTPWVLGVFAALFVVFALTMFGLFELQLPHGLRQRLDHLQQRQKGGTLGGSAAMGILSALLVGPCMTAPLAGALLYIGDSGDAWLGGTALLALGLGMGTPLLLVGALGPRLLPRPGPWMNRVKVLFGFILLGMALYFLGRVLGAALTLGLWGAWLIGVAVALHQVGRSDRPLPGQLISRTAGLVLGLWGSLLVIGSAGGATDPLRPLAFVESADNHGAASVSFMSRFEEPENLTALEQRIATADGQWTLVDVYADWCVSCKVIEEEVFGDPRVQAALDNVQLLRPDVTANDADDQAMMNEYGIIGPPTLLLIGPDGQERRAQRIVGEIDAEEFLERLQRAQAPTGATS